MQCFDFDKKIPFFQKKFWGNLGNFSFYSVNSINFWKNSANFQYHKIERKKNLVTGV
jgi:hypothetical protein